jgi:cobalt-zinc-cadmium efflux system protein
MTDHNHDHGHHHHGSSSNLGTALLLNISFTILEIIGGLWTNSVAILSDAVHDLGDSLSLALAWYFDRKSRKGRTPTNTYGYRRYSLLGGLITALVLIVGLTFVLWHAVARLFSPEAVNAEGMVVLAIIGVFFNGAAVLRVRRGTSLTEKIVSWHLLEDTLSWVAILIGAGVMSHLDVPIIDPLLSIGISLFVLWNVIRSLKKVFHVLLQRTPADFDVEAFEAEMLTHPKLVGVHHTHSWSIDGESHVLTTHLVLDRSASREDIIDTKEWVRGLLSPDTFEHITVDVELEDEDCIVRDNHC